MGNRREKLKIGILLRNRHDGPGGLEKVLEIVAREMPKHGVELYFYGLYPLGYTDFTQNFAHLTILPLPLFLAFFENKLPKALGRVVRKAYVKCCGYRLFEQMAQDHIDLLITMDLSKQFLGNYRFLKRFKAQTATPILSWVHISLTGSPEYIAKQVKSKIALFNGHLAISQGMKDELEQSYQGKNVQIIYNPIDKAELIERAPNQFIYIGRITKIKRVDSLLQQLQFLKGEWHLDIYGSTGSKIGDEDFQKQISTLSLEDKVTFHGWQEDPWCNIERAGVLLLNSTREGFGLVIVEAMMRGIPVISTDCPVGPSELIQHSINGWLYPVNEEEEMTQYLQKILDDELLLPDSVQIQESVDMFKTDNYIQYIVNAIQKNIKSDKVL